MYLFDGAVMCARVTDADIGIEGHGLPYQVRRRAALHAEAGQPRGRRRARGLEPVEVVHNEPLRRRVRDADTKSPLQSM